MSLRMHLEDPMRDPFSIEDFGVKKRVKDLGVIEGGLRGFALSGALNEGRAGEDWKMSEVGGGSIATSFS